MKEKLKIIRYKEGMREELEDFVAEESPLTIFVNGEQLITLLCSPDKMDYLALGFLWAEGFLTKKEDVESIFLDKKTTTVKIKIKNLPKIEKETVFGKRIITSGCGKGMTFFDFKDFSQCQRIENKIAIAPEKILSLVSDFQKMSVLFKETGGVHSAALSDGEKIVSFAEDLGRHNALDKIFGQAFWESIALKDKIVLTSGRLSSEIVIKVVKRSVPMLISPSAPTNLAVRLARQMDISLIGFARGRRLNIYSPV